MKTLTPFSVRDRRIHGTASYLASELKELGVQAGVANVYRIEEPRWENYDRVIIGTPTHYSHYHSVSQESVKKHVTWLNSIPSAFCPMNLVACKPERRTSQTNSYARRFPMSSQWRSGRYVVTIGVLHYSRYRWYDRFIIRPIMKVPGGETDTHKEAVYTDWKRVVSFTREIAHLTDKPALK